MATKVYKALADPTRRKILQLLRERDMNAGELAEHFDVTKPTLSRHFSVLQEADLIQGTRKGNFIIYRLNVTVAWTKVPADAQIPIHWNAKGEVDGYGNKSFGLLIAPSLIFALSILLAFIPRMEPRGENLLRSQKAYKVVWGFILVFMLGLHLITTSAALGKNINVASIMAYAMGILFMAIGNYMGKVRSNFMFGIRSPWTLSSELSWNKTHRLGGRLFVFVGLLVFLSAFFQRGDLSFGLLIGGLLVTLILIYAYSYWVWKQDKDRKKIS